MLEEENINELYLNMFAANALLLQGFLYFDSRAKFSSIILIMTQVCVCVCFYVTSSGDKRSFRELGCVITNQGKNLESVFSC